MHNDFVDEFFDHILDMRQAAEADKERDRKSHISRLSKMYGLDDPAATSDDWTSVLREVAVERRRAHIMGLASSSSIDDASAAILRPKLLRPLPSPLPSARP